MFAKPFNRHRPYGTVTGDSRYAFEQEGQLYDNQERPVDIDGKLMELAPAAAKAAPEQPAPAAPSNIEEDDDTLEEEKVDLRAWAMGDPSTAATPWQSVREAAGLVLDDITELKSKAALKEALLKHFGEAA